VITGPELVRPLEMLRMRASARMRLIGCSTQKPVAPWFCTALSAAASDARGGELWPCASRFAAAALVLGLGGEPGRGAAREQLGAIMASLLATRGKLAIGSPNWRRAQRIVEARSTRFWATPMARAAGLIGRSRRSPSAGRSPGPLVRPRGWRPPTSEAVEGDLVFLHAAIAITRSRRRSCPARERARVGPRGFRPGTSTGPGGPSKLGRADQECHESARAA